MLRSEAIRILEVVRKEQQADMTQRDCGFWSIGPDDTLSLDNHTFMNYNDLIEYLETQLENTSGGFGDDFA